MPPLAGGLQRRNFFAGTHDAFGEEEAAASSGSWPGVRMVMARLRPFTEICKGSSTATSPERGRRRLRRNGGWERSGCGAP